jgi:hypothetical protein
MPRERKIAEGFQSNREFLLIEGRERLKAASQQEKREEESI